MITAILLFLLFSIFSLTNAQELVLNDCEKKIIENQDGKFVQTYCRANLNGEKIGVLKIEESLSPPRYGKIEGYLKIGNLIFLGNSSRGTYLAVYEPYRNGLIIMTECGASYSNSNDLNEVFKAMLNCFKEKEKEDGKR